jgi:hypothetical protein
MSSAEVARLIERTTGQKRLSDQKIGEIVLETAIGVRQPLQEEVKMVSEMHPMPAVHVAVDSYDPHQREVLRFDEAIHVKAPQPTREKISSRGEPSTPGSRVSPDVLRLEKAGGGCQYLTAGITAPGEDIVPVADGLRAKISAAYGGTEVRLKLVAITAGAKAIRARLVAICGVAITLI